MEILIYALIFVMGAFIGSFASLAIYRLPLKEDILIKHSFCPSCKEKLTVRELIPIFSYLFLGGKCGHCGEKIRPRYLILEILSGVLFTIFILSFKINLYNIDIFQIIVMAFIAMFFVTLILLAGINKENKKVQKELIYFNIILSAIYVIYMYLLKINVIYDIILIVFAAVFYAVNVYYIKNERDKNLINFAILILLTRIFMNSYIVLFGLALTLLTFFLHKILAKTEVPIVFYYTIFIISIFIGVNFII